MPLIQRLDVSKTESHGDILLNGELFIIRRVKGLMDCFICSEIFLIFVFLFANVILWQLFGEAPLLAPPSILEAVDMGVRANDQLVSGYGGSCHAHVLLEEFVCMKEFIFATGL
jgi:hypothetical protein